MKEIVHRVLYLYTLEDGSPDEVKSAIAEEMSQYDVTVRVLSVCGIENALRLLLSVPFCLLVASPHSSVEEVTMLLQRIPADWDQPEVLMINQEKERYKENTKALIKLRSYLRSFVSKEKQPAR